MVTEALPHSAQRFAQRSSALTETLGKVGEVAVLRLAADEWLERSELRLLTETPPLRGECLGG